MSFSDLAKSITSASRASQFTGVESISLAFLFSFFCKFSRENLWELRVCEKVREKIEKSYCTVPWGYKILGEKERRLLYYLFVICDYICEMWGKNINIKKKKNVKEIGLYIGDRCFLIGWENLGKLPAVWNFYFNDGNVEVQLSNI